MDLRGLTLNCLKELNLQRKEREKLRLVLKLELFAHKPQETQVLVVHFFFHFNL